MIERLPANPKFINKIGNRYGRLEVKSYTKKMNGYHYFLCLCDCGNEKEIMSENLRNNKTKSCGCLFRDKIFKDITGNRYGRLTILNNVAALNKRTQWLCRCDCGNYKIIYGNDIKNGKTKSCGCLRDESTRIRRSTHKMSNSAEYEAWCGIKKRCYNPKSVNYKDYGGRGITVCDRWLKFENFLEDMGLKPSDKLSLDRIDNNGNYEKDNCRWADAITQGNNKRDTLFIEVHGVKISLRHICRENNLNYGTVYDRIKNGCSPEYAINVKGRAIYGTQ